MDNPRPSIESCELIKFFSVFVTRLTTTIICWFLFACFQGNAQENRLERVYEKLNHLVDPAEIHSLCKGNDGPAIDPGPIKASKSEAPKAEESQGTQFAKIYSKIFSTVVLGNADVITNGNAFAYSQDNVKNTFSLNGNIRLSSRESASPVLLDLGVAVKNKDNTFNYYQNNTWASDITLKLGVVVPVGNATLYYMPARCKEVDAARLLFMTKKRDSILNLISTVTVLEKRVESLKAYKKGSSTGFADLDQKIAFGAGVQDLKDAEEKHYQNALSIIAENDQYFIDLRNRYLIEFNKKDITAAAYGGYRARWLNFSASYTNASIKIDNVLIFDENIEEKLRTVSKGSIEAGFNYQIKTAQRGYFTHFNAGGRFHRFSYLDNPDYQGKKFTVAPNGFADGYNVFAENVMEPIGTYHDLHDGVLASEIFTTIGWIPNSDRNFLGLLGKFSATVPVEGNEYYYAKNYTALVGPMIRLTRDKTKSVAAATFTILAGFENTSFEKKAWDVFVLKATAAFPFNIFENAKK